MIQKFQFVKRVHFAQNVNSSKMETNVSDCELMKLYRNVATLRLRVPHPERLMKSIQEKIKERIINGKWKGCPPTPKE